MPWRQLRPARRAAIVLLGLFALVFAGIITVADRGDGKLYWGFLDSIPAGDKLGHFGLLAIFSLLLNLALGARRAPGRLAACLLGSVVLAAAMTLEEFSQLFVATRTFDIVDWLASLAGIAAGGFAARRMTAADRRGVRAGN